MKRHLWFLVFLLSILAVDQVTKHLVVGNIHLGTKVTVINGLLNFLYSRNTGGAFSLFPDKPTLFLVLSIAAMALLLYLYFKLEGRFWSTVSAVAIMGGALGNLIDRLHYGQVVDFIDIYWGTWHWYVFNVADAFISLGAAGLFITTVVGEISDWRRKRAAASGDSTRSGTKAEEK